MAGFSSVDKALLSASGLGLTALTGGAAAWAWTTLAEASLEPPATAPVIARVAELDGTVKSRHRETLAWADAAAKQDLRDGDRIRTMDAAHAEIHYGSGVVVTLDPNTQITVHGPSLTGSDRLIAVDVVDGSVRARVETGTALTLRDATGREQATVRAPDTGAAEVVAEAPESPEGAIQLDVVEGGQVTVETGAGETMVVEEGEPMLALLATPKPTPTPVRAATPTPLPPLLRGMLPVVVSETANVRIRRPLPPGVVSVSAKGRRAVLHDNGDFELELFGLKKGIQEIDLVYKRADGTYVRQVQRVQVR